jgi:hypothetical protein
VLSHGSDYSLSEFSDPVTADLSDLEGVAVALGEGPSHCGCLVVVLCKTTPVTNQDADRDVLGPCASVPTVRKTVNNAPIFSAPHGRTPPEPM